MVIIPDIVVVVVVETTAFVIHNKIISIVLLSLLLTSLIECISLVIGSVLTFSQFVNFIVKLMIF